MILLTKVNIEHPNWRIEASDEILCVGSCFAEKVGERMMLSALNTTVNPWGALYNPASIADALNKAECTPDILILTLGTTHVFERNGQVVANCQKLPAHLFTERDLSIEEIVETLSTAIERIHARHISMKVILTVSPYRYANWNSSGVKGMHGNQLSKARLLLACDEIVHRLSYVYYFPAYEIVLDELRDYRFYDTDMLHPSAQAVDYIWERFQETVLSQRCREFIVEMEPIRKALAHRPLNPDSDEYKRFIAATLQRKQEIIKKYQN